jgi:hypothetical protein
VIPSPVTVAAGASATIEFGLKLNPDYVDHRLRRMGSGPGMSMAPIPFTIATQITNPIGGTVEDLPVVTENYYPIPIGNRPTR